MTGGTASSGSDYIYIAGTALITGGNTGVSVRVTTTGDLVYEGDETVLFVLSSASVNASISDSTGVVTITDDDTTPSISVNDIAISEAGSGYITISLSNATTGDVTVTYVLTGGTASSGSDYIYIAGTALITGGNTGVSVKVTTTGDEVSE